MTTYNVHLYREMKLRFDGLEAESTEAAASIARDKPTVAADSIDDCDGETLAALVDVAGDEEYEQSRIIDFEPVRERNAAPKLLATLKAAAELRRKWRSQDEAETIDIIEYMDGLDSLELDDVIAEAEAAGIRAEPVAGDPAKKPYSVLLLYPDDVNDSGTETYYAFVEAPDAIEAVAVARREAVAAQEESAECYEPDDFAPLLVVEGHHSMSHD